jgi:hypothetical protein
MFLPSPPQQHLNLAPHPFSSHGQLRLDSFLKLANILLSLLELGLALVTFDLELSRQRIDVGLEVGDQGGARVGTGLSLFFDLL